MNPGVVTLHGRFTGNGTSSPTAANTKAKGITCARTGSGTYTLTLPGQGSLTIMSCNPSVESSSARLAWCSSINESTRVITIKVTAVDGTTAVDLTSSEKLRFTVNLLNSSAS